jgi:RP/EB family microtubule-associated protein
MKKFWDQYYPGGSYNPSAAKSKPSSAVKKVARNEDRAEIMTEYQRVSHQINTLKVALEQVEKEREFYFSKLREIELYIQTCADKGVSADMDKAFKEIQAIMYKVYFFNYKTEDGFEAPEPDEEF